MREQHDMAMMQAVTTHPPVSTPSQSPVRAHETRTTIAWGVMLTGIVDDQRLAATLQAATQQFTLVCRDIPASSSAEQLIILRRSALLDQPAERAIYEIQLMHFSATEHCLTIFFPVALAASWSPAAFLTAWLTDYAATTSQHMSELVGNVPPAIVGHAEHDRASFWQTYLADIPLQLNLPVDKPRTIAPTGHIATIPFAMTAELHQSLQALKDQVGVSLADIMLAAYVTLAMRYSGQRDIVVAITPFADSVATEHQATAMTLAVRADLEPRLTFRQLVHQTRAAVAHVATHAAVSLEAATDQIFPDRAFFPQLGFTLHDGVPTERSVGGIQWRPLSRALTTPACDLWLDCQATATTLAGEIAYNADLFDAATVEHFITHLQMVLAAITRDPDQLITHIAFLTAAELHQQLVAWQSATIPIPDATLHGLVAAQAESTPTATAIIAADGELTYGALNARANQLAHYLRQWGAGPEQPIAVCLNRTSAMLVALLGILKSGSAYVPLDPAYPSERLAYSLRDSQARVLVTERHLHQHIPDTSIDAIYLDEITTSLSQQPEHDPPEWAAPHNLAYVIYTSGSTGRPKGVAIEHHSAAALIAWAQATFTMSELRGVLAATSYCFDLSIFEMFVPLSSGGTVILADNALALPTLVARDQVTLINTVPSAITELLALEAIPSSVQTINLAGEPLAGELVQRLYQQPTIQRVNNLYGPTEDTTYSTHAMIARDDPLEPSIGRAIANSQAYILDEALQPVPVGVAGELYLGGAGLARGYLHRPDATAERFVADSFSAGANRRLYRTGDIARLRSDGTIAYQGRSDHQVKIRGFRIELGEIETALRRHPQVEHCLVMAREDFPGDKRLVAYIIAQTSIAVDELRTILQTALPSYMIPAAFVFLTAFPLTPNGKIDRRALPPPDMHARGSSYQPPRTPLEAQLAAIWGDLLHVENVGIADDFFALGGHSLLATRVISRLRAEAQLDLPMLALFECPTIAQLARYITQLMDAAVVVPAPMPIQPIPRDTQSLGDLIMQIAQLTPEEIDALLGADAHLVTQS